MPVGIGEMSEAAWKSGQPCDAHELGFCSLCRPSPYPKVVFMTTGAGLTFHRSDHCPAMLAGQTKVARRGGDPAPVVGVVRQTAEREGMQPCAVCFPA